MTTDTATRLDIDLSALRDGGVESLRLMDEARDVGGIWHWNRYPGVRCDIGSNVDIPLLEETGHMPTERYARGAAPALVVAIELGTTTNAVPSIEGDTPWH